MKYIFIFFPLIGLIIGFLEILWYKAAIFCNISVFLYASVATIIPVLITGGVHLDGYADTWDALSSRAPMAKKIEILKDPHTGAFAIIYLIMYFLVIFGAYGEFYSKKSSLTALVAAFVLSRILGGLASLSINPSSKSGLLFTFSSPAEKNVVKGILFVFVFIIITTLFFALNISFIAVVCLTLIFGFIMFRKFCLKHFGGISGDLAGFYISFTEGVLVILAAFSHIFL